MHIIRAAVDLARALAEPPFPQDIDAALGWSLLAFAPKSGRSMSAQLLL